MKHADLYTIAPTLATMQRQECFIIPDGYINNFTYNVERLLLLKKDAAFEAPVGYFEKFPETVNNLILITKSEPFAVPDAYFKNLQQHIATKISTPQKIVFDAPNDYFELLPQLVQQRIFDDKKTKQTIFKPSFTYAFATIAATLFLYFGLTFLLKPTQHNISENIHTQNKNANIVAVINTPKGLQIKVSGATQKQITKHIDEQLIQTIDESILYDELASVHETKLTQEQTSHQIQDFLIENNIDDVLLLEAIN